MAIARNKILNVVCKRKGSESDCRREGICALPGQERSRCGKQGSHGVGAVKGVSHSWAARCAPSYHWWDYALLHWKKKITALPEHWRLGPGNKGYTEAFYKTKLEDITLQLTCFIINKTSDPRCIADAKNSCSWKGLTLSITFKVVSSMTF